MKSIGLKKNLVFSGNFVSNFENPIFFKESYSIKIGVLSLFEKNQFLVKDCFVFFKNEKLFLTILIQFFVLKRSFVKKDTTVVPIFLTFSRKFLNVLNKYGYYNSKRLVFHNLNKVVMSKQKKVILKLKQDFFLFNNEIFFDSGILIYCLLKSTRKLSFLISKFIAHYFKLFHRSYKLNKFLLFLIKLINISVVDSKLKGFKIQIKGRFKNAPRANKRIFLKGLTPMKNFKNKVDFSFSFFQTSYGIFSIKVWLFL